MRTATRRPLHGLTAVLLAAGGSSRLGAPKQLVRIGGRALLRRAVDAAGAATGRPVIVVLGADRLRLRALLARSHPHRDVRVVAHPGWRKGLAGSLRRGLAAVPVDARGVLFVLADQPLVDSECLARLAAAWRQRPAYAAAAVYSGRIGVPAILPRSEFPALRRLEGDEGARKVLAGARGVTRIDMPEAEVDVDTPEDEARLPAARARFRTFSRPLPRCARPRRSRS